MSETIIRPLTEADREAWLPLWHSYLEFYKAKVPAGVDDITFTRLTGGVEPMGGFIAERDGQALGMTTWVIHRSTWNAKSICYLQDLFTVAAARGTGIGRGLIAAVNQLAREKDCFRVYWMTHETNVQGQALYDKVAEKPGFIIYRQPLA